VRVGDAGNWLRIVTCQDIDYISVEASGCSTNEYEYFVGHCPLSAV
jgi:hypothetical protein